MSKAEYLRNRKRVYDIYGIEKSKRSRSWNMHHIEERYNGGSDEKGNLFPTPRAIHRRMPGHCEDSKDNKTLHEFIKRKYGKDPYERE